MTTSQARRFNLIDAFVLVAATGAGLAWGQGLRAGFERNALTRDDIVAFAIGLVWMWAVAVLALNLTRFRAGWSEMARRPGFSAVVAIIIDWVFAAAWSAITELAGGLPPLPRSGGLLPPLLWNAVQFAHFESPSVRTVTVVWLVLAMAGCWRAEKTWIDRTGRALGIFWMLLGGATFFILSHFDVPVTPPGSASSTPVILP